MMRWRIASWSPWSIYEYKTATCYATSQVNTLKMEQLNGTMDIFQARHIHTRVQWGVVQKFGQHDNWVREPHEHHFSWKLKETRYNLPRICSLSMFFHLETQWMQVFFKACRPCISPCRFPQRIKPLLAQARLCAWKFIVQHDELGAQISWKIMRYCWWKKSRVHQLRLVVHPNIDKVLYIPGGAGFLPSTVSWYKYIIFQYIHISIHQHSNTILASWSRCVFVEDKNIKIHLNIYKYTLPHT